MFKKIVLALIIMVFCSPAFSATGFLKGERTSGMNKICYYNGPSGDFTKTISSVSICPQSASDGKMSAPTSSNVTGFLARESTSGLNKTCYYNSHRGTFTKTVGSANLCPQSAKHSF